MLTILLIAGICCNPPVIPTNRTFTSAWQNAGHPGPIVWPATIVNVRSFPGTDDWTRVTAAIRSLSNAPGIVYFPAGTYLLHKTLEVPPGVVLRGESHTNTLLRADHSRFVISIAASQTGAFQPLVSGYTLHSDTIVVSNGAAFAAGDYAEIQQENEPWLRASVWARKIRGQIVRIAARAGNTLTLERPLRLEYQAELRPEIRKITPVTEVGIENLKVDRWLTGDARQRDNIYTIYLNYAARCWIRGVEGENTFGGHVAMDSCTQCEVTGCYFHHAWDYDGGGSGYGVRLQYKTGECKIENNIFQHLRHSMLVQLGVNGNVFGYNYSREPRRTEFPSEISSDVTVHGNFPYANLFEGNIVSHIWIDNSHGANGPLNTFFRNRAEAYGFNVTDAAASNQNVVGNELLGRYIPFLGNGYTLVGQNFTYGNRTRAGLSTNFADVSCYLTNTPGFWTITNAWPTIGPPHELEAIKDLPARARFRSGTNLTVAPALTPPR